MWSKTHKVFQNQYFTRKVYKLSILHQIPSISLKFVNLSPSFLSKAWVPYSAYDLLNISHFGWNKVDTASKFADIDHVFFSNDLLRCYVYSSAFFSTHERADYANSTSNKFPQGVRVIHVYMSSSQPSNTN